MVIKYHGRTLDIDMPPPPTPHSGGTIESGGISGGQGHGVQN
ncbi:MAG: hypothetical protein V1726_02630 [Methanobacteriota archaeon]